MSLYDLLKQKLYGIEEGAFQEVCNNYLLKTFGGTLESPGAMEDKTKTRTGRPDTFLAQDDGTYILAEITTQDSKDKSKFVAKLKSDLLGCLDFDNIGVTAEKVKLIVLCCNSTVDAPIREELNKIIEPYRIKLKIVPLLTLADYYYYIGRVFAHDFLGIPFNTGQVLSKEEFLQRYQGHKQIATRLDNKLFGRERELDYLKKQLEIENKIVITGNAGIGKSKLALQAIDDYIKENPEVVPYYILSVRESIFEDLNTFLTADQSYIIFIDDANRQMENLIAVLNQAIAAQINVKIIMTVRDYALDEVAKELGAKNFLAVFIGNLGDDTLNNILYAEPFHLLDAAKRARVIEICKGNARLAIMAAEILAKNPDSNILKDASSIYDEYFSNLTNDITIFKDPLTIKILGVLAFIETLDFEEPTELKLLELFDIPVEEFRKTVGILDSHEFVDLKYLSIAKIGDQVLGTYFFYQAFCRQQLLSREVLIFNLFERYKWRVQDTLIPAINTFGVVNVLGENPQFLLNYLEQIKGVESATVAFFEVFGPYLPTKVFIFIKQLTDSLPDKEDDFEFINSYKKNGPNHHDPILHLLDPFFKNTTQDFLTAIGLAIRYVQKKKGLMDMLVKQVKDALWAGSEDAAVEFEKQFAAYNFFKEHLNDSKLFKYLFFYGFQHVCLNSSFNWGLYEMNNGEELFIPKFTELRKQFWDDINLIYGNEPEICYDLLIEYLDGKGNDAYVYLREDQEKILTIIKAHLSPANFGHCYFVQEYINLLTDKHLLINSALQNTQKKFRSPEYKTIKVLTLERNDKRIKFSNYSKYSGTLDIQQKFLCNHIKVNNLEGFKKINVAIQALRAFKYHDNYHIGFGLTLVFENIFKQNIALGYEALMFYLSQPDVSDLVPGRLFNVVIPITGQCETIYQIIKQSAFQYKQYWLERFYECIPESCINKALIKRMLIDFKNASNHYDLHQQWFDGYEKIKPGTLRDLCAVLVQKSELDAEFRFKVDYFFIEKYPYLTEKDLEFAKKLYLNQDKINPNFDPRGSELFAIMKRDVFFIREYMDFRLKLYEEYHSAPSLPINGIWEFEKGDEMVYECLLKFCEDIYCYGLNTFASNFFQHIKPEYREQAFNVLKKIIDNYPANPKVLSTVWEIGRNYLKEQYKELIKYWILKNANLEVFTASDWCNNSFSSYGGAKQQWGDYRALEYTMVANAIGELPEPYLYVEFQDWLVERIAMEKRSADWERKREYRRWH
ncbi:ATP-binding protein [Mucilaginibacter sp. OK098]|uniref:nSTAND3 domain-containing NTPase n=1 Tax=Mucilaginibacter sp. OK098 TaxID=1855297 RepID=UPI000914D175|nr:ATP-binding protein [Mucilaginibacter sp. OK098]SHN26069.1 hypothetical protein SAMN05216524_107369 [Mucilaginibacter sp. OK098]